MICIAVRRPWRPSRPPVGGLSPSMRTAIKAVTKRTVYANKRTSKQANKRRSEEANKRTSEEAKKRKSKQADKRTSEQADKRTSEQANEKSEQANEKSEQANISRKGCILQAALGNRFPSSLTSPKYSTASQLFSSLGF
jgi:hypothetical protein